MKNKRVFITGGNGFIGSVLVDKLGDLGFETASFDGDLNLIDNNSYYRRCLTLRRKIYKQPSKVYSGDIRNIETVRKYLKEFRPDTIVHLAGLAMARPLSKYVDQMIPINLYGTMNVLQAFEESATAEKMVYTSSSMAYGHFKQTPQTENFTLDPINSYGACKAAGEYFVKLSRKKWSVIRPTSVYGFTDCANRVSQLLIDAAWNKKSAWVVKGESLDFSYIDDVADGFVKVIMNDHSNGEMFNISAGVSRAASEFAEIVKGYFPDFRYEVREPEKQQVYRGPLDIQKATKLLSYTPKHSLEKGIKKTIELIKEYEFYNTL